MRWLAFVTALACGLACDANPYREKCGSVVVTEQFADGGARYISIDDQGEVFECGRR